EGVEKGARRVLCLITRAKERLYLSVAQSRMLHGQTRYNIRSRFFDELPQETLKWLTPKVEAGARWGGRSDNAGWGRDWFARPDRREGYAGAEAAAPLPAFAKEQRAAETGFRIGQQVFHTKF